jgi:hypothetical protein
MNVQDILKSIKLDYWINDYANAVEHVINAAFLKFSIVQITTDNIQDFLKIAHTLVTFVDDEDKEYVLNQLLILFGKTLVDVGYAIANPDGGLRRQLTSLKETNEYDEERVKINGENIFKILRKECWTKNYSKSVYHLIMCALSKFSIVNDISNIDVVSFWKVLMYILLNVDEVDFDHVYKKMIEMYNKPMSYIFLQLIPSNFLQSNKRKASLNELLSNKRVKRLKPDIPVKKTSIRQEQLVDGNNVIDDVLADLDNGVQLRFTLDELS